MKRRIWYSGSSSVMALPKKWLQACELDEGRKVVAMNIEVMGRRLILTPVFEQIQGQDDSQ